MLLEADRMRNLRLREDDRRPEMTVVRNEYERGENMPSEALEKEIWGTSFQAHPYRHSTIGWRSDIEKVPIEKLRAFYDTFYWPNNATVSIIGDFSPAETLELIKRQYGAVPKAPHPLPQVYTEEPPQTGPRRVVVKRPGELGIVTIAHKIPPGHHTDYAALRVLGVILTDGRNSRTITVSLTHADGHFPHAGTLAFLANNVHPTIALTGEATVNEGSVYTLNLGVITDGGADSVTAFTINWGDGTVQNLTPAEWTTAAGNFTHTYADGGAGGTCLLYTSDAADERSSVDLGGRRIIKKKNRSDSRGTDKATV